MSQPIAGALWILALPSVHATDLEHTAEASKMNLRLQSQSTITPSHTHDLPSCANHNLGVTVTPTHTDTLRCYWLGFYTNSRL